MSDVATLDDVLSYQRQQWESGERVPAEELLRLHPHLAVGEAAFEVVAHEIALQEDHGGSPTLEEYIRRFPELASELRKLWAVYNYLDLPLAPTTVHRNPAHTHGAAQVEPAPLTGLPRYEILEELGRGGMAVVYKAMDLELNRVVALKMILSGIHADQQERTRFKSEAETIARLQNPHIVQIFDVGEHERRPYLSLEFCAGGSLAAHLKGHPLPANEAAQLTKTLALAVHAAHEQRIVHRDLKPANVLLAPTSPPTPLPQGERGDLAPLSRQGRGVGGEGGLGTPKITDFGLAKKLDAESGQTSLGNIVGTPSYMAPEQAAGGTREIGRAADVYALGAILYELLTGRPPFKAATVMDTLQQVMKETPVSPQRLNRAVPPDLETICLQCLRKEPDNRYATAAALAEDLKRFLAGEPITARPVGALERLRKWVKREPVIAALTAGVALTLLAGTAVASLLAYQATAKAREARQSAAVAFLERAQAFCEQGDSVRGLFLMTQGLEFAETARDPQLTEVIRWNIGAWRAECHTLDQVLLHPGEVAAAAFSPDKRRIATGCDDGQLRIWRADSGALGDVFLAHPRGVLGLAFHPNGRLVVTSGRDSFLRAWDLERREKMWEAGFPSENLHSPYQIAPVAFSPDGTCVAVGSRAGVKVFAAETGMSLGPSKEVPAEGITFLPDGRLLTVGVELWAQVWKGGTLQPDGEAWRTAPKSRTRGKDSRGIAVSPNGKYLVTSQLEDRATRVWDLKSHEVTRELPIGAVATHISPDGRWLITGTWEGEAQVWDLEKGVVAVGQPLQHSGRVLAVQFHPDSSRILTAGTDKALRVWHLRAGRLVRECRHEDGLLAVSFNPDGTRLATGTGWRVPQLCLWDIPSGELLADARPGQTHLQVLATQAVTSLTTPDWPAVLTQLYTVKRFRDAYALDARLPPARSIADVVFLPDGRSAFVGINGPGDADGGSTGFAIYRWSFDEPGRSTLLCRHTDEIWRVAASPNGKRMAAGGGDHHHAPLGRNARLWSDTGEPIGDPLQHTGRVTGVAFSRDGAMLLTGSHDGATCFWNARTGVRLGEPLRAVESQREEIRAVAVSPDGREFVTGGSDHLIRRWDLATRSRLGIVMDQRALIYHLAYSHDGRLLLSGSANGSARLWHVATSQPVGPLMSHESEVRAVAYSPDGRWMATGGREGLARVWSPPAQAEGSPETILRELEVQTGMTLADDHGCQVLEGARWLELRGRP
jgi:eukaryotic-like serine/threonine-protein kinase